MSKYLKWYDSYLDHTPTEDLAKNELESAHRKIKQLTKSLAKANERVRGLEDKHLNLVLWHNLDPQQAKLYSDRYANKLAIEKKIEVLDEVESVYIQAAETSEPISFREAFDTVEEQLRKEQE